MCVEGTGTERRKQGGVIRDEEKNSMRSDGVLEERSIAWLELVWCVLSIDTQCILETDLVYSTAASLYSNSDLKTEENQ